MNDTTNLTMTFFCAEESAPILADEIAQIWEDEHRLAKERAKYRAEQLIKAKLPTVPGWLGVDLNQVDLDALVSDFLPTGLH